MDVSQLTVALCGSRGVRRVTFSGGEPFAQPEPLAAVAAVLKDMGLHILIYSGYTFEELRERALTEPAVAALLGTGDLLVDGPFILAQRDMSLAYRGSHNQRIIDLPASIRTGTVVISPLQGGYAERNYA
jgi:anaerobic ribonucleoside-triphosphate reductase activating protein